MLTQGEGAGMEPQLTAWSLQEQQTAQGGLAKLHLLGQGLGIWIENTSTVRNQNPVPQTGARCDVTLRGGESPSHKSNIKTVPEPFKHLSPGRRRYKIAPRGQFCDLKHTRPTGLGQTLSSEPTKENLPNAYINHPKKETLEVTKQESAPQ